MIMQNKDINKILLYIIGSLLLISTIFVILTNSGLDKLWGILPFILGSTILLLNKFKKIN